jgi:pilus assembly protein CpaE
MNNKKGKSISIFSAKGGVGKTITTINLAGIFKTIEKKVLIIDLNLSSGGISIALNRPADKSIYNLVDDYENNRHFDFKNYVTKYDDDIDFLASPKDPRQATKIDSKYLDLIIDKACYNYDIVLIDMNHTLSEINIVTLDKVDNILYLMTNDPMDLKNMKSIISVFRDLDLNNYKVLLNNSVNDYKNYFSLFDMKNIMKANIDYTLSSNFFIKNIDEYIMNGQIITLQKRMPILFAKEYATFMTIAADILKESGDKNE